MEHILNILNVPILQAFGVIILVGLAERIGIPVISTIKSVLKLNGGGSGGKIDEILKSQTALRNHYNDDTTRELKEIKETQNKILEIMNQHNRLDERVITLLENFREYGISLRKE